MGELIIYHVLGVGTDQTVSSTTHVQVAGRSWTGHWVLLFSTSITKNNPNCKFTHLSIFSLINKHKHRSNTYVKLERKKNQIWSKKIDKYITKVVVWV